jgi:hypothetical protein
MAKALSITVHPAPLSGEYLTVADAMRQVLDIVEGLESAESTDGSRQIVWRLTEAHTNSPPFTIVAEPFPLHPSLSVALQANRVASEFARTMEGLLNGHAPDWLEKEFVRPVRRVLERNLNGVGKTDISIEGEAPVSIVPQTAKLAVVALDRLGIDKEAAHRDWTRTEYGTVEGEVQSLTRWNGKPALVIEERLSGEDFTGVIDSELVERIGSEHTWREAWEGRRVFVTGALHFNAESILKRADVLDLVDVPWTKVDLSEVRKMDLLNGRAVSEHIRLIRGDDIG